MAPGIERLTPAAGAIYEPEEMVDRGFVYVSMGRPAAEELAEALPMARRA